MSDSTPQSAAERIAARIMARRNAASGLAVFVDPVIIESIAREELEAEVTALRAAKEKAEAELAEAASRINCAGPVAHRIDVLRRELSEKLEAAESERDALRVERDEELRLHEMTLQRLASLGIAKAAAEAKNQRIKAVLRKARAHIAAIHPIRESQMNTVLDIDELLADPPSETQS